MHILDTPAKMAAIAALKERQTKIPLQPNFGNTSLNERSVSKPQHFGSGRSVFRVFSVSLPPTWVRTLFKM